MFSATGHILTGTQRYPDIYTVHTRSDNRSTSEMSSTSETSSEVWSGLNVCGYIPVLSTVTGFSRSLLGVVHTIVHLVNAIFDAKNRLEHFEEAELGAINIGRGLIEMVPIAGNITMLTVDILRSDIFSKRAEKLIDKSPECLNHAIVFGNGREIAKRPLNEFNE